MEYNSPFMLGRMREVSGCASRPISSDNRSIVTINNTEGDYDSVEGNVPIAKVYPKAKDEYRRWWRMQQGFKLGEFKSTQVQSDTEIANLVVCISEEDGDVVDEDAVKKVLNKYGQYCAQNKLNVHINRLDDNEIWSLFEESLTEYLVKRGVNVTVYI